MGVPELTAVYIRVWKRWIDILLSLTGIVFLCVPMLVIAAIIKLQDPGPAVFRQERVGIRKTRFELLKFRTMRQETPHDLPKDMLSEPERYMLPCGWTLRKYSLDELPQLFNILRGDMSIVGPRPVIGNLNERELIEERDRYGANDIRPGLTGLAQISGRDMLSNREKAALDGEYVRRQSFLFDCRCFFLSIGKVLTHDGFSEGGGEQRNVTDHRT